MKQRFITSFILLHCIRELKLRMTTLSIYPAKEQYRGYRVIVRLINHCFNLLQVISHIRSSYDTLRLQQSIDRRKSLTSQTNTRRFSASSVNIHQNGLPYVSSFHDLNDTLKLAEKNNIPMEEIHADGMVNPGCETTENGHVQ